MTVKPDGLSRSLSIIATAAALSACGGSPSEVFVDTKKPFLLSQTSVACTTDLGIDCEETKLKAAANHGGARDLRPNWHEKPADQQTQVVDHLYRNLQPDGSWELVLGYKPNLAPGIYTGEIEVTIDISWDPFTEYVPSRLAYRLEVKGESGNLSTLDTLAGAGDWQGSGGNAARNPAVPVTLDASKFNRRWTRRLDMDGVLGRLGQRPTLAGGKVYLAGARPAGQTGNFWALSEYDGAKLWSVALPGRPYVAVPAGDQIVALADVTGSDAWIKASMTALTAATGAQRYQREVAGQVVNAHGAAAGGGLLVLGEAIKEAIQAFDLNDGTTRWTASAAARPVLFSYAGWSSALDGQRVYTNLDGELRAHRLGDGAREFSIAIPSRPGASSTLLGSQMNQVPVLADASTVLSLTHLGDAEGEAVDNQLSAVDLGTRAVRWTIDGRFTTQPVAGNGVVYVGTAGRLEARSLTTGALLWSWALPDQRFRSQLVLTQNLLFVATDRQTLALDLQTHQPVWRYPAGGWIGLSDRGLLYILSRKDGAAQAVLTAFNLR